jgi:hypothetical protein
MYIHSSYVLLFLKKGSHEKQEKGAYQVRRNVYESCGSDSSAAVGTHKTEEISRFKHEPITIHYCGLGTRTPSRYGSETPLSGAVFLF